MPSAGIVIAPRRSAAFFAFLAIGLVVFTYALILLIAAACVYLPYLLLVAMHTLHAQVVILLLGGLVIAGTILFSIVPRREKFVAPGLLLEPSAHPLLFDEIERIAADLNEPVPREVYLVGNVNAFVTDRGGLLGIGSRRVMGIGLPLFSILNVSELRGVLAHEFAHYYAGDTRLGPWTYKTQSSVARTFRNIGSIGESVSLPGLFRVMQSVVSNILAYYFVFFLRVINFISRKAEFRADELACLVAGSGPVLQGLRAIHGAALAWPAYWNSEVSPVLNAGSIPPIAAGFATFLTAPNIAVQVDQGIQKEISEGKTKPYDSHPPLKDRLAALGNIKGRDIPADTRSAVSLLNDPNSAELRFVQGLNPELNRTPLRPVRWNEISELVTIPSWRSAVAEHAAALCGLTVEAVPDVLKDLPRMCAKMKDPPGTLLDRDQRAAYATHILSVGCAIALLDSSWTVREQPGLIYFERDQEQLRIFALVQELRSGSLTPESWKARCRELSIADLPLAAPSPSTLPPRAKSEHWV